MVSKCDGTCVNSHDPLAICACMTKAEMAHRAWLQTHRLCKRYSIPHQDKAQGDDAVSTILSSFNEFKMIEPHLRSQLARNLIKEIVFPTAWDRETDKIEISVVPNRLKLRAVEGAMKSQFGIVNVKKVLDRPTLPGAIFHHTILLPRSTLGLLTASQYWKLRREKNHKNRDKKANPVYSTYIYKDYPSRLIKQYSSVHAYYTLYIVFKIYWTHLLQLFWRTFTYWMNSNNSKWF